MNPAERILSVLGSHLKGEAHVRLFGGAALILGYGLDRATEDADLLLDDAELAELVDKADFGEALAATNRDLEEHGLYLTHIWGPEQQILGRDWRAACRTLPRRFGEGRLSVSVLGPIDLVLTKLCRADDEDMADVSYLIGRENLTKEMVEAAVAQAVVPTDFTEVFEDSRGRLLALFDD